MRPFNKLLIRRMVENTRREIELLKRDTIIVGGGMRFLVLGFGDYESASWDDAFGGRYPTVEDAKAAADCGRLRRFDMVEVVDLETNKVVAHRYGKGWKLGTPETE
jgi:hypothetical protein